MIEIGRLHDRSLPRPLFSGPPKRIRARTGAVAAVPAAPAATVVTMAATNVTRVTAVTFAD
ncbi:hypothetical protein GCM10018953_22870 [Streptosporangium nondiastaticum]